MPYFKWTGTNIEGAIKKGRLAAYSSNDLSQTLFHRGVALLHYKKIMAPSFLWSITYTTKSQLFASIAQLLRAGVLLPDVFIITAKQSAHPLLCDILFNCALAIKEGKALSAIVEKHTTLYDPVVKILLIAGDESGNSASAFESASLYCATQHEIKKNIRSVLAMPVLTLFFFIAIAAFIFIFIIPRFAQMFASLQCDLPALTCYMITLSGMLSSIHFVVVVSSVVMIIVMLRYYFKTAGSRIKDRCVMRMPFIGNLVCIHTVGQVLNALSLLVNNGVALLAALETITPSIGNSVVKRVFEDIILDIKSGKLLSNAMMSASIFLPETIALIQVGEESGTVGAALQCAAQLYNGAWTTTLARFIFFLQPFLIVVLGILIMALIFAVYLPIMEISRLI
jgi:type IV pilus assembly protein PilC